LIFNKNLPPGLFARLEHLPLGTCELDVQEVIAKRTGLTIPLDRIAVTGRWKYECAAMISFHASHIIEILNWAMGEDAVKGTPVVFERPRENSNDFGLRR
jgi:hypothetical protein